MKRLFFLTLMLTTISCSKHDKQNLAGRWRNDNENCWMELNNKGSFTAANLPLDVENEHYIINKNDTLWQGKWTVQENEVKLILNSNEFYNINYNAPIFGEPKMTMKLLEEAGGETIFFNKD